MVVNSNDIITRIAGTVLTGGYTGDGGLATSAKIRSPIDVATDTAGNIYFTAWQTIRRIDTASGVITTIAGEDGVQPSGFTAGDDGPAINAKLAGPEGIAIHTDGTIYVCEVGHSTIRKIDPTSGNISRYAGKRDAIGLYTYPADSGDGGDAINANLYQARSIDLDSAGNLYICETGHGNIRKVDVAGNISTIFKPTLTIPILTGIAIDETNGVLYTINWKTVYKYDSLSSGGTGVIIAGIDNTLDVNSGNGDAAIVARLKPTLGICTDNVGNIYLSSTDNTIRKIEVSSNNIVALCGTLDMQGSSGDGGAAIAALLRIPQGVTIDNVGNMYIADAGNYTIRKISTTIVVIPPPANTNTLSCIPLSESVKLIWSEATTTATPGDLLYQIVYNTSGIPDLIAAESLSTTKKAYAAFPPSGFVIISGLTAGTIYYFRIIVKDVANKKSIYNQVTCIPLLPTAIVPAGPKLWPLKRLISLTILVIVIIMTSIIITVMVINELTT